MAKGKSKARARRTTISLAAYNRLKGELEGKGKALAAAEQELQASFYLRGFVKELIGAIEAKIDSTVRDSVREELADITSYTKEY